MGPENAPTPCLISFKREDSPFVHQSYIGFLVVEGDSVPLTGAMYPKAYMDLKNGSE